MKHKLVFSRTGRAGKGLENRGIMRSLDDGTMLFTETMQWPVLCALADGTVQLRYIGVGRDGAVTQENWRFGPFLRGTGRDDGASLLIPTFDK